MHLLRAGRRIVRLAAASDNSASLMRSLACEPCLSGLLGEMIKRIVHASILEAPS